MIFILLSCLFEQVCVVDVVYDGEARGFAVAPNFTVF